MFIWIQGIVSFPDDSFVPLHKSHGISGSRRVVIGRKVA
jgi:hypothetical protein